MKTALLALSLFFVCKSFDASGQKKTVAVKQKAIICLTYDDGLNSQLANAIPHLDSFGFRGTFFINSIPGSSEVMGKGSDVLLQWKRASKSGHELGNHTLFHPCPEKFGWQHEVALERYTLTQLLDEIVAAHQYINMIEGHRPKRNFAFPCNNTVVANASYIANLQRTNLISGARLGGDQLSIVSDIKNVDTFGVPSWHVMEGTTGGELIAFAQKVIEVRGLGVYQFHGIGGPLFQVSNEAHLQLLRFLKANDDVLLVTTFNDALNIIKK